MLGVLLDLVAGGQRTLPHPGESQCAERLNCVAQDIDLNIL